MLINGNNVEKCLNWNGNGVSLIIGWMDLHESVLGLLIQKKECLYLPWMGYAPLSFTMRAKCHAHSHESLWLFQGFISAWPFNPESVHKCVIIGITTQKSQQNCFAIERRSFSSCLIMDQKRKFQGLRRNHFDLQPSDSVHHCSTVGVLRTPWWAGP